MNEQLLRAVKVVTTREFPHSKGYAASPAGLVTTMREAVTQMDWWSPDRENVVAFAIDNKYQVTDFWLVSVGTLDQTMIHAREVFRPALMLNAAYVALVHNHPSGNVQPSTQDIRSTSELVNCAELLKVPLLDHLVINQNWDYTSMREHGFVAFSSADSATTLNEKGLLMKDCEPDCKRHYEMYQASGAIHITEIVTVGKERFNRNVVAAIYERPDHLEMKIAAVLNTILNTGAIQ